jgi:hypothetical protein
MKTVYVPYAGNLYELTFDHQGAVTRLLVSYDNNNRPPQPLSLSELPHEVLEKAHHKLVKEQRHDPKLH